LLVIFEVFIFDILLSTPSFLLLRLLLVVVSDDNVIDFFRGVIERDRIATAPGRFWMRVTATAEAPPLPMFALVCV